MIRGGSRLMCSPYLTGSLAIMLVIVTFNYWTVSTENSDLAKKIHEMSQQLKSGSIHINSLEEELKHCKVDKGKVKSELESKYQQLKSEHGRLEQRLKSMDDMKEEKELEEAKFSEDAERQMKVVDSLRDEIESVKQSLESVTLNLTTCSSELAAERADRLLVPPQGAGHRVSDHVGGHSGDLGPGQLPDVNPQAVNVVRKETHGSGLRIEEGEAPAVIGNISSSSRLPPNISSSTKAFSDLNKDGPGVVPPPKIVVNEGVVMPVPNLDKAEDDSNVVHEDGIEDDQNPDGQIDESVDAVGDQHYLKVDEEEVQQSEEDKDIDKEEEEKGEKNLYEDAAGFSNENEGEEKLENLKESLNQQDENENLEPLV